MRLTTSPINPGSYTVWHGTPNNTVCYVNRLNQYECEVSPSYSLQDEETSRVVCLMCFELGFKTIHFSVSAGSEVTSIAEYVKTVNGLDFYTIDWISASSTD